MDSGPFVKKGNIIYKLPAGMSRSDFLGVPNSTDEDGTKSQLKS